MKHTIHFLGKEMRKEILLHPFGSLVVKHGNWFIVARRKDGDFEVTGECYGTSDSEFLVKRLDYRFTEKFTEKKGE